MRKVLTTFALVAALAVAGAAQAAQATTAKKDTAKPAATTKPAAAASHSVKGTVKSMDASSLVITKSGKAGGDMTFTVNADTKKDGAPAVGSSVSVRYRTEGSTNVATAVTAQAAKPAKTQAKK
ncbi:MAG TPA: DUF5666 domain-containing protein [Vicinamibacterales bacterium]|jgi:hypothetical protein